MNDSQHKELFKLLENNIFAVLATVSATGEPESALVGFVEDELPHIYFQTRVESRKHQNVIAQPKVSIVIGWDGSDLQTLQLEGVAAPVKASDLEHIKDLFRVKNPFISDHHLNHPSTRFFCIYPTWLRYSDYSFPPNIWEHTF